MNRLKTILVTGGAGYIGSNLVPKLLDRGYHVKVLDLYIYGTDVLHKVKDNPRLEQIKGDIRDQGLLRKIMHNCNTVIHLACISNDPSVELDPALSTSINYEAFEPLVKTSRNCGIRRFIFASSGSIYGITDGENVTEDHPLIPVSLYNKYKAMCENILKKYQSDNFTTVIVRPATVCGYSPRQRLDLTVNMLTNHAVNKGSITVFGGKQMRPNIHMQDMIEIYTMLLEYPDKLIAGRTYNAGFENYTIIEIAEVIKHIVQHKLPGRKKIDIVTTESNDPRTYHMCSDKIKRELEFEPKYTIRDGVLDLIKAFTDGKIPDPMSDMRYYNVKLMKHIKLK